MTSEKRRDVRAPRTLAQWYCLLFGATLLLVGILGFIADRSFDTGSAIESGSFLGFEVNGWHNLVHLASGIVLLAAANTRPSAKAVAIGFGFVYGVVALWGLIDGESVLSLIPVNTADNLLHVALSGLGIALGMMSPTTKKEQLRKRGGGRSKGGDEGEPTSLPTAAVDPTTRHDADAGTAQAGRFTDEGRSEEIADQNNITRTRS